MQRRIQGVRNKMEESVRGYLVLIFDAQWAQFLTRASQQKNHVHDLTTNLCSFQLELIAFSPKVYHSW